MENIISDDEVEIVSVIESPGLKLQLNLFNDLERLSKQIPTGKQSFKKFVESNFKGVHEEFVVEAVWKKLNEWNGKNKESELISISSDEESQCRSEKKKKSKDRDKSSKNGIDLCLNEAETNSNKKTQKKKKLEKIVEEPLIRVRKNLFVELVSEEPNETIKSKKSEKKKKTVEESEKTAYRKKRKTIDVVEENTNSKRRKSVRDGNKPKRKSAPNTLHDVVEEKTRRKSTTKKMSKAEIEALRRDLLLDKLIEVTLPPIEKKIKKKMN